MQGARKRNIDIENSIKNIKALNIENSFDTTSDDNAMKSYKYHNVFDAFIKIIREEGVLALYTCVEATVARAAILNAVELASYDVFKQYFVNILMFDSLSSLTHLIGN